MGRFRSSRRWLSVGLLASFKSGDGVTAISPDDRVKHPAIVDKLNDDGTVEVTWDDADGGPESYPCRAISLDEPRTVADFNVGDLVKTVFPKDKPGRRVGACELPFAHGVCDRRTCKAYGTSFVGTCSSC